MHTILIIALVCSLIGNIFLAVAYLDLRASIFGHDDTDEAGA